MPLEGHWQRVNTPVRALTIRERRVVAVALALVAAAAIGIVLLVATSSTPRLAPGCIDAIVPGVMGGQPVDACGRTARVVCANHVDGTDPGSHSIEAACRRAGIR